MLSQQQLKQLSQAQRIWLGFSGGLDSTVLLHLLAQQPSLRGKLAAIHVHHGLSANADAWLEHCQQQCAQWDIPFFFAKVHLKDTKDGLEQAARIARYQVYAEHVQAQEVLVLAHHNDDQIETFFMRLTRGAGIDGLAGMEAQRTWLGTRSIYRPLLGVSRNALEQYALDQQLSWVNDESNADNSYERNWWRNQLIPQLWQQFPHRRVSMQRSLEQIQQDNQLLHELLQPFLQQVVRPCAWPQCASTLINLTQLQQLPVHYWSYLIKFWLATHNLAVPSKRWLDELLRVLRDGDGSKQSSWQMGGFSLYRYLDTLFLHYPHPEQPKEQDLVINGEGTVSWAGGAITIQQVASGVVCGTYQLAPSHQARGQKIRPLGRPSKDLKSLFQEAKIPPVLRDNWPVLFLNQKLCAVVGIAVDGKYYSEEAQVPTYHLSWNPCNIML